MLSSPFLIDGEIQGKRRKLWRRPAAMVIFSSRPNYERTNFGSYVEIIGRRSELHGTGARLRKILRPADAGRAERARRHELATPAFDPSRGIFFCMPSAR